MKTYGVNLAEGSAIQNMTSPSGLYLPEISTSNVGELFYQIGSGLMMYNGTSWLPVSSASTLIFGTQNQIISSSSTGEVTLSLPQDIHTFASPTFSTITVSQDPVLPLNVATKGYVDSATQSNYKAPVRVVLTSPTSGRAGLQIVDDIQLNEGDRVLVAYSGFLGEPTANGIYVASSGPWVRASDADTWDKIVSAHIFVQEGTMYSDTGWLSRANPGGTLGTFFIFFVQITLSGIIETDFGLSLNARTISISPVGTAGTYNNVTTNTRGQVISGSNVSYLTTNQPITLTGDVTGSGSTSITTSLSATGVAAGTYKSVTVDLKGRVSAGSNPTTLAGYGITDAQPLNSYLTSLSSGTDGIVVRSGTTAVFRSISAGSSKIQVTNANGTAGNPTIDVIESNLTLNNLAGTLSVSKGGTNLTAVGSPNQILGTNTAGTALEYRTLTAGSGITITPAGGSITIAAINSGTVTSVNVVPPTSGITSSGGPITTSGSITLALANDLSAVEGLTGTGIAVRTADDTWSTRSVTVGAGLSISNADGVAGNISITNTGVTSNVAGTGISVSSSTGASTITNTGVTSNVAGTGISVTGATGASTITNTGVTSITAGTGISTSAGTGAITITNTGVTSVSLALPAIFTVTGSPVTSTGTLTGTLASQTANTVFAAPSGTAGTPSFRSLVPADLPYRLYAENNTTGTTATATGTNTAAYGAGAVGTIFGSTTFAGGQFATAGDFFEVKAFLRAITTTVTATELFLDNAGTQRFVIPNNSVVSFRILVSARRTDAVGGAASYEFVGAVRKDATAASTVLVGTPVKTVVGETTATWDALLTADTTNGSLRLTGTGVAGSTIRWGAVIDAVIVTN